MYRYLILAILCSISFLSQSETTTTNSLPLGFTIRLVPSFFYNTYGLEAEYPFNGNSTLGVNLLYYTGSGTPKTDSSVVGDGTYTKSGFIAELQYKYYFSGTAPTGFYAMVAAGYNSILYPDGSTRPFVLFNSWNNQNEIAEKAASIPDPYIGSIGVGYQIIMIEPHISGNVVVGAQFQTGGSGLSTNIFITPSLGWTF
jgi:hypothetical protein